MKKPGKCLVMRGIECVIGLCRHTQGSGEVTIMVERIINNQLLITL
jgi:hypothetical protein